MWPIMANKHLCLLEKQTKSFDVMFLVHVTQSISYNKRDKELKMMRLKCHA